jgi:anthranilate 1,2-dioxygenase small subunit
MDLSTSERLRLQQLATELNATHAELIDDDRLEKWPDLFVSDCTYRVIARENHDRNLTLSAIFCDSKGMLVDRIISLRKANIFPVHSYRHILGPTRIVSEHEFKITTQTNYAVLMTRADGHTGIYNAGKYIDEIDCGGDHPLFISKVAVFDTNVIDTMMVRPI